MRKTGNRGTAMPTWLKIILGILAGFALFAGAIVAFAFWLTSGMVEPIDRQIAALKAGNLQAAYEETSEAFREATPLPAFTEFVDGNPILKDVASHSFFNRSFENDLGTVKGSLTSSSGGVMPVAYRLVKEKDIWKILHIQLGGGEDGATP
jgi:hypothetical protein